MLIICPSTQVSTSGNRALKPPRSITSFKASAAAIRLAAVPRRPATIFDNTLANLQRARTLREPHELLLNSKLHLTAMQHFVFLPAGVALDGGAVLKGNFWAGHNPAT